MRTLYLFLAIAVLPVSVAGSAKNQAFADAAELVVNALAEGRELKDLVTLHSDYDHDVENAPKLKGCQPNLVSNNGQEIGINWICPAQRSGKYTAINILEGRLFSIDYQTSRNEMRPSTVGIEGNISSPENIARRFSTAVEEGMDPTIDGLIPMSTEQREAIGKLDGWQTRGPSSERDGVVIQYWRAGNQGAVAAAKTVLHFDEDDRPIGVWIQNMQAVRRVTYESAR